MKGFGIESAAETAAGALTVHGIDVSSYQGAIDWQDVATNATVQGQSIGFAYIKATEDSDFVDPRFAANWQNSKGLLPRGAYHFFHATATNDGAGAQADNFVKTLRDALAAAGQERLELPPMVDVEWGSVPAGVTVKQAVSSLQYFLTQVEGAFGKRPILYTAPAFWQVNMANSRVFAPNYLLWIARYGAQHTGDAGFDPPAQPPLPPGGWTTFHVWQNAVQKGVAGIEGLVDRDQIVLPTGGYVVDFLNQAAAALPALAHELKTVDI